MGKWLWWIPTVVFFIVFGLIIVIFHPLQMIGLRLGYLPHKKVVDSMIWWINHSLLLVGSPIRYDWQTNRGNLPTDRPLIIVSNHQSMFDIPCLGWAFRRHHPKYISKKSLAKGIPSISYNIRHGGSIAIDRKNRAESLQKMTDFAQYLNEHNRAGSIFPEGTRSRDGHVKPFKPAGLLQLLRDMPDAVVVPVALHNFWKLTRYGMQPIPFGTPLRCTILPPVSREQSDEDLITELETQIRTCVEEAMEHS